MHCACSSIAVVLSLFMSSAALSWLQRLGTPLCVLIMPTCCMLSLSCGATPAHAAKACAADAETYCSGTAATILHLTACHTITHLLLPFNSCMCSQGMRNGC
jgi:hypothetical protein